MAGPALPRIFAGLLALGLAVAAPPAAADARAALHAAFQKNLGARTYRATITDLATNKQVSTMEFQAPDRYRMQVAGGPSVIIANNTQYMTFNGQTMKVPISPAQLAQYRSDSAWKRMEANTLIQDGGPAMVGTEAAKKYHWITTGKDASTGDAWVSVKSGHVIQVETAQKPGSKQGAVRVRYSDFDSAKINIVAPK